MNHLGMTVPDMDEATKFFKEAFGAKIAYDGLTLADEPARRGDGRKTTRDSSRGKDCRQRMIVIGTGPGIELFEIKAEPQRQPVGLSDYGINHLSIFVSEIDPALEQAVKAGATALSEIHGNSRYEDTPGNASVYVTAPWGGLIELQCIPNGYYYPTSSETKVWIPPKKE
ncbi:VOC family protein [Enterococcus italicus]|uniref:VOC family protein n=1 Tax=Enterococcus italicus TaxID=246144 RepID=UPI0030B91784